MLPRAERSSLLSPDGGSDSVEGEEVEVDEDAT